MSVCFRRPSPKLIAILSASLAACGGEKRESAATGDTTVQATAAGAAATTTSSEAATVTIAANDYTFEAPASIPAGVTAFRMTNSGKELHHAQLIRIDSGKTFDDLLAAMKAGGPPPKWIVPAGGPNAVGPGAQANATQKLQPGNYAIVCFVGGPDRVPHLAKGMVRPLTVTAATSSAAEPNAHLVMTLKDYDFVLSTPLTPGTHTIRIENAGPQVHEVELVRLAPGKSAKDLLTWLEKQQGPPPGEALGGIANFVPGMYGYVTADFTPGDYALICFWPDAKDGKPHFAHGMVKQIKVG